MKEGVVGAITPPSPIHKTTVIVNTLYRTGTNYFFTLLFHSIRDNNENILFESLHSPAFAAVTPEDCIQFFVKRDPFDSIVSMIYARLYGIPEDKLKESLDQTLTHYADQWILHLNNVIKNNNIEIVDFVDLSNNPKSLIAAINNKLGLMAFANDQTLEYVEEELEKRKNPGGDGFNHTPSKKSKNNEIIREYLKSNNIFGKQEEIYYLYNKIAPTIVI